MQSFQDYIAKERERLHAERETIFTQQHDLETKLAEINREFAAIEAYETAKRGKPIRTGGHAGNGRGAGPRRGSKREGILSVLVANPHGLNRGEILDKLGLKGQRAGEMSVSNALTALTKGNQVVRKDGKYVASAE